MEIVKESVATEIQSRDGIEWAKRVMEAWQSSGLIPLRRITCEIQEGHLRIKGVVHSFYMKQMAQAIASHVRGVPPVVNDLIVIS